MKAVLTELLVQLRRAAVDGVVPEIAFAEHVRALHLGAAERDRLRGELARLGLPVQESGAHAGTDSTGAEKVVRSRGRSASGPGEAVSALLQRYADGEGCVTAAVVVGVARLAGLDERATAALRAGAKVRDGGPGARLLPRVPTPGSEPWEGVLLVGRVAYDVLRAGDPCAS